MGRMFARLIAGVLLVLVTTGIVFVAGMRTKSPLVLDTVRRTSRAMKPLALKSAGTPGANASVIRHVGRTTGRAYETPVGAVAIDDGFVIALPYGPNTDWLKNVLASGSATIVDEGSTYDVHRPEVLPMAQADRYFSPQDRRAHRVFRVDQCLRVRRLGPEEPVKG
jgi:deazaflavin-dependent oxidoreductase (nitroreductase family)